MTALWHLSAAQLTDGYRRGLFTPLEALAACLERVDFCQPMLNAMVTIDPVGAKRAAQESGRRWASGQALGVLDGVPVSVKDNMHVQGLPTSWGSRLLQGFKARHDELPVARLRAAGAVLFGKTNLPEFAMQGYTSNPVYGTTRNPWRPALTSGGSSGGAVAAVASGGGPLALATDGGGSIRRPAAHGGLVGFKPSAGLVPRQGGLPEIFLDYEVAGGIGRTVRDVADMTGVLAGTNLVAAQPRSMRARILYVPRFASHPVDAGITAAVAQTARRLAAMGHCVEEEPRFDLAEDVNRLWPRLSNAGLAWMLQNADRWPEFGLRPGQQIDFTLCGEAARANGAEGQISGAVDLFEVLACLQTLRHRLGVLFSQYDFILTPATAALPWPAEQTHPLEIAGQPVGPRGHAVFTAFVNAAGLPGIALPGEPVQGLPSGFQLVGAMGADATVLELAQQYEAAHPWAGYWPEGMTREESIA